jgi:hypothetical protein
MAFDYGIGKRRDLSISQDGPQADRPAPIKMTFMESGLEGSGWIVSMHLL